MGLAFTRDGQHMLVSTGNQQGGGGSGRLEIDK
jgi:hypothetical protein